jgi:nucleotide-binding universal stress UspA family protein
MQPDRTTNETAMHGQDSSQITVGVDGSPASLAALRWAHKEAIRRSATLTVLTVWPAPATSGAPGIPSEAAAHAVAGSAIASVLRRESCSATVWVSHYPADATDALLRRARKSQLVVVGRHSAHSVAEHLLGSVTERLLSEAACPVAVIHAVPEHESHRIVVGIDGSPAADTALYWATAQALLTESKVEAILVWDWRPEYGVYPYGPSQQTQERRAAAALARAISLLSPDARSIVTTQLIRGHPADVLLAAAEDADLLVVGNKRGGPLAERVLGSVSRRLATTAERPVVVTHAATDARNG